MVDHRSRVLWVTDEVPDRGRGGGSIRQAHLFSAVASAFPTDLVVVGQVGDEQIRALATSITELPDVRSRWTDNPLGRRLLELTIMLTSRYPSYAYPARPARRALARQIRERSSDYALICVEHAALAPMPLGRRYGKLVITFHHLFSGMARQELEIAPGPRQRWFRAIDLRKAERLEERAVRAYDTVVVCSVEDATALGGERAIDRACIRVIPNGVELSSFRPSPLPRTAGVLFPATLGYAPNVDGALWFCAEIWPRIRAGVPDATLALVGRKPVPEVVRLGDLPGVEVHADVPSMTPYYAQARVVVVPLRAGTGTRLKALEAMASARPVVGTRIGLEGIGVNHGEQALLADAPGEFAEAVLDILRNDNRAERLGSAGRRHVEQRFGWDRIGDQYVELLTELLAGQVSEEMPQARRSASGSGSRL
jgi:polysaccharide biosynthesis protein PslH